MSGWTVYHGRHQEEVTNRYWIRYTPFSELPITATGIVGNVGDKQKEQLQMLYYNSSMVTKLGRTEIRANY